MDRQAFRNRMQQLKQYREQNPGKTYLDFKKYAEGGEIPPSNKPIIPEEPQPYKGKLYKDRYGRKYTEDQMNEYYDSSTDEIDRFTGKPFVRGLKPVGDIEDAANATPVGDAISAYDTYKALKNKDWEMQDQQLWVQSLLCLVLEELLLDLLRKSVNLRVLIFLKWTLTINRMLQIRLYMSRKVIQTCH